MATLNATDRAAQPTGWAERHNKAVQTATVYGVSTHQASIVTMLKGWQNYAVAHKRRFESPIGEDYVLGPMWQQIGLGIRGLLNGETGQLDCGTLDAFILDTLTENGFDTSEL